MTAARVHRIIMISTDCMVPGETIVKYDCCRIQVICPARSDNAQGRERYQFEAVSPVKTCLARLETMAAAATRDSIAPVGLKQLSNAGKPSITLRLAPIDVMTPTVTNKPRMI